MGVLTIIGVWPVAIMFIHVREALRTLKMIPKYAMYQVCVFSLYILLAVLEHIWCLVLLE